jgi:hypothetical protein
MFFESTCKFYMHDKILSLFQKFIMSVFFSILKIYSYFKYDFHSNLSNTNDKKLTMLMLNMTLHLKFIYNLKEL